MKKMKSIKKWLFFSVISFFLSSLAIFIALNIQEDTLTVISGVVFWLGFIAGLVFLIPIQKQRKRDPKYKGDDKRLLFLRFFRNKPAIIFDILLIIGAFLLILFHADMILLKLKAFAILEYLPSNAAFISVRDILSPIAFFAFLYSLEMHFLFNGKNYEYVCMHTTWQYNLSLNQEKK
ncbi:MAG: hypothetical protein FWF82_06295 [Oscillospiraceae bacterium]|nr:hypothetical protein [Oscillospiraceae bacterium]